MLSHVLPVVMQFPLFQEKFNNNISLFCEDNILSIAYLTYGPLQVKTIQLFTKAIYKKIKVNLLKSRNYLILIKFSAKISGLF